MAESDFYMPEYWPANRLIGVLEHVLIEAKQIIGQLKDAQIESLKADKITGQLTNEQIEEIEAAKIAGQLTSEQIESLEAAKISGQLVDAQIAELKAGKVKGLLTSAQIESIEATKISGQLTDAQLKEIQAAKIAGQISHSQIAAESVWAINILAGSVTAEKIEAEAVTTAKLATGSVIASKLAAGSVVAEKIAAEAVTAEKIGALQVTTAKLAAESVTAGKIAANAITAEKILAEAITSVKIAAGAIIAEKIAAGAITAEKLNVKELSAISSSLGTITAGVLKAVTIEGGKGSFTGKLSAEELDLIWAAKLKEALGSVRWVDAETLQVRGLISISSIGSKTYSKMVMETNLANEEKFIAELILDIISPSTGEGAMAGLKFKYRTYPEKLIFGDYHPKTPPVEPNRPEASDFVQLSETRKVVASRGNLEVEMLAAQTTSGFAIVNHTLGAIPKSVVATISLNKGAVGGVFAEIGEETATQFTVRAARPFGAPGVNTKFKINWWAST